MVVTVQISFQVKQSQLLEVQVVSCSVLVFVSRGGKLIRRGGLVEVILLMNLVTKRRILRWWRKGRIEVYCRVLVHGREMISLQALVFPHVVHVVVPALRRRRMRVMHIAVSHPVEILLIVVRILSREPRPWWIVILLCLALNAESGLRKLRSKARRQSVLVMLWWVIWEGRLVVSWSMGTVGAAKLCSRLRVSDVLRKRVEGFRALVLLFLVLGESPLLGGFSVRDRVGSVVADLKGAYSMSNFKYEIL